MFTAPKTDLLLSQTALSHLKLKIKTSLLNPFSCVNKNTRCMECINYVLNYSPMWALKKKEPYPRPPPSRVRPTSWVSSACSSGYRSSYSSSSTPSLPGTSPQVARRSSIQVQWSNLAVFAIFAVATVVVQFLKN